jgi:FixJ family two-component response regulator
MMTNSNEEGEINGMVPTVFVVDDTRQVREALSRLLLAAGYRVRSFESAECFLEEHDTEALGCLLLDVCMPSLNGIELQRTLMDSDCARPIVFLSGMSDIPISVRTMKSGAVDFLVKPIDHEQLLAAVVQAVHRDAKQRSEQAIRSTIQRSIEKLTPRERQVMRGVSSGRLNKQIAAQLGIGEKTVKVHRARMLSKLGVRSVAALAQLGARVGIHFEPTLCDGSAPGNIATDRSRRHPAFSHKRDGSPRNVQSARELRG